MGLKEKLGLLGGIRSQFGIKAMGQYLVDRIGNKLLGLEVTHVVWLDAADVHQTPDAAPDFTFRFLTPEEVEQFAQDPATELSDMIERARSGHDLCFAALASDGRLAAYGWYALDCIEAEHCAGVAMSYPADVAYMYKGLTLPDFRGKRLHGLIMGLALLALGERGVTKLVSTVDWCNWASLRSCARLGYADLGRFVTLGRHHHLVRFPRAAADRGVRFGKHADLQVRTSPRQVEEEQAVGAGT